MRVNITLDAKVLVPIVENHGGYTGQQCNLCHAGGWSKGKDGLGLPFSAFKDNENRFVHKEDCPIGMNLTKAGKAKKELVHAQ